MCFIPFLLCVLACLHELAVADHTFIIGRALWSAQGDDAVFHTLLRFRAGMHARAVEDPTFIVGLAQVVGPGWC